MFALDYAQNKYSLLTEMEIDSLKQCARYRIRTARYADASPLNGALVFDDDAQPKYGLSAEFDLR